MLAEAIAIANLSDPPPAKTLSDFARRGSLPHRRCVLQVLADVDPQTCAKLLIPILADLPHDSQGSYWTCPEASFTHVVMKLDDDAAWREYLRAAKRSEVGLRMEMMNPMNYTYIGDKNRRRRLAFLAAFLDDDALRDMSQNHEKFEGPCAGFTIPRLHVRDFAASKIASILQLGESPDEFWTEAEWANLRQTVRARLAKEGRGP